MDATALTQLLEDVQAGRLSADDAVARLQRLPFTDLGFARVDHHRALRQGVAETVFGPGKTPEQAAAIVAELLGHDPTSPVLLTRTDDVQAAAALAANPDGTWHGTTVVWRPAPPRPEQIVVITAGTGDLPVADECAVTLTAHGVSPSISWAASASPSVASSSTVKIRKPAPTRTPRAFKARKR